MSIISNNIINDLKSINDSNCVPQEFDTNNDNIYYFIPALNEYIATKIKNNLTLSEFSNIINSDYLIDKLIEQILIKVKTMLYPSIVLEYNLLLEENIIDNTQSNSFAHFINIISKDNEFIEYYFEKYQLINALIKNCIEFTSKGLQQLFERLNKDLTTISSKLKISDVKIKEITGFDGDDHNEWQSPFKIEFNSGNIIYYKSRSFDNESFIYDFIEYLANLGLDKSMGRIPFIDKGEYGYMQHIENNQCSGIPQVENFYYLQGINLSIFYFLNCIDLIADNIIVRDGLPYYFDLECILLPQKSVISDSTFYSNRNEALQFIKDSVLVIGMLPEFAFSKFNSVGASASGLSNTKNEKISNYVYEKHNNRYERKKIKMDIDTHSYNIPHINNIPQEAELFLENIMLGFEKGYFFFMEHNKKISEYLTQRIENTNILSRIILRTTFNYEQLIQESLLPSYFANDLKTKKLFDNLKNAIKFNNVSSKIIDEEIFQINRLDIPTFFIKPHETHIQNKQGKLLDKYTSQSGLTDILDKIKNASTDDFNRNLTIIKYTFTIHSVTQLTNNNYIQTIDYNSFKQNDKEFNYIDYKESCLKECEKIADKILDYSFDKDNEISFWNIIENIQNTSIVSALDSSTFNGLDGIALFYYNLYLHTSKEKYRQIAIKIINQGINEFVNNYNFYNLPHLEYKLSFFGLPISTFHIAELFIEKGEQIATITPHSIFLLLDYIDNNTENPHFDLISGVSGTIIYLAKLHKRTKQSQILKTIEKLSIHIINNADAINNGIAWADKSSGIYAPGMSHGSSAIAYALILSSSLVNNPTIKDSAILALQFERSMFDQKEKYWYHLITKDLEIDKETQMHIWAYGSAGILQSRILINQFYKDDEIEKEIKYAYENLTKQFENVINFNYSSGIFGILDQITMLSVYNDKYKNEIDAIRRYVYYTINNKNENQFWTLAPLGRKVKNFVESISLFNGLAGVGNVLLNTIDYNTSAQLFDY